ncbi:MAG: carboxylate-amine ligase [Bacteroidetes bacterium]|nr:carboxylate-amine ligase [Bacteroidota bacterium]MBS1975757.1 carboxylate-amine ligase [Bacteroidota bacterium]
MEKFTLGVEEEYMVVDPATRELKSHDQKIVELASKKLHDAVKAEMHQAVVEVGTGICTNVDQAHSEIRALRRTVAEVAGEIGLKIGAAGTHPFSHWSTQLITPNPRYDEIVNEMQEAARSNLIFGLHVHVGIADKNMAIHIMNTVRYFLPHVYALSTNSPFWEGRNTGFKSFRTKVFDKFPRTGLPDYFNDWDDFKNYVNLLIRTRCIDNAKKIWWDVRVHPFYDTIEFRICDVPMLVEETIAITALFQAIVAKLYRLRMKNMSFIVYNRALISENKWRASRYGIDGRLIDFGKQEEVDTRHLIHELLDFVDDVVDDLGSRAHINNIKRILEQGTGADRQLQIFEKTHSLQKVVDYITEQTLVGL